MFLAAGLLMVAIALAVPVSLVSDKVAARAEALLVAAAGPDFILTVDRSNAALHGMGGLGLDFRGLRLSQITDDGEILRAGRLAVGIAPASLLTNRPDITSLDLAEIDVDVTRFLATDGGPPTLTRDSLEKSLAGLFDAVRGAEVLLDRFRLDRLSIRDILIAGLPEAIGEVRIDRLSLQGSSGARALDVSGSIAGTPFVVSGKYRRDEATGRVSGLELASESFPLKARAILGAADGSDSVRTSFLIDASEGETFASHRLNVTVAVPGAVLRLGNAGDVPMSFSIAARLQPDVPKIEIETATMRLSRSEATMNGAILVPAQREDGLRFELVTNRGISNPEDSPAPPVAFAAKIAGTLLTDESVAVFEDVRLATANGDAAGRGSITYGTDTPNAVFAIDIPDMALETAKQFWPAPVARGARQWALANLAGGRISNARIDVIEPLGALGQPGVRATLSETTARFDVGGVRFDVVGEIPPVRDAFGSVAYGEGITTVTLQSGKAYLPTGRVADIGTGTLVIEPETADRLIMANLDLKVAGPADAIAEIISYRPIRAQRHVDFKPEEFSGTVAGDVKARFALNTDSGPEPQWSVALDTNGVSISRKIEGRLITALTGRVDVNPQRAVIDAKGAIDQLPATIKLTHPFGDSGVRAARAITLDLDAKARSLIAPGLETIVGGMTRIDVADAAGGAQAITADLSRSTLALPWIGWEKGVGIDAKAAFRLVDRGGSTEISDFELTGNSFAATGRISVSGNRFMKASFPRVRLNKGDDVSVQIDRVNGGYAIKVDGAAFDARPIIRKFVSSGSADETGGEAVTVTARIGALTGFHGATIRDVRLSLAASGGSLTSLSLVGTTRSGARVEALIEGAGARRKVRVVSGDAGSFLRFLNLYDKMQGGGLTAYLSAGRDGALRGEVDISDLVVVNEPRLSSLVSSGGSQSPSLREAVNRDIDTSRVPFDHLFAEITKGEGYLHLERGVLRGPLIGSTFQGVAYDRNDQMRITGTFMPAYGFNRLFGEIPVLGALLGNGRDRGLIGITFLLTGPASNPTVNVNPISVIAPGIFRSIFEFRR